MDVTVEEFEEAVGDALDSIPQELSSLMDNVVVLVEPEPPEEGPRDLLGLYDGIPLTERGEHYTFVPPDRILIFRGPLTRLCRDRDELVDEIGITVVHEVAHHFGIADEQLHAWGWG